MMRWTPEKVEALRFSVASGMSYTDIAKLFGVSVNSAKMRRRRLRRPDPPRQPPVDDPALRARWDGYLPGMKARVRAAMGSQRCARDAARADQHHRLGRVRQLLDRGVRYDHPN
jgi:transposase-like protein